MRILFLVSCVTDHDEKFVRGLSESGHTTRIFSFHRKQVPVLYTTLPGISLTAVPLRIVPRAQRMFPAHLLPHLRRTIREFKPDLIHAGNTWNESFLAALSGFHPLLVMPYGSDVLLDTQRSLLFRYANRKVFREADWVTCDAEHVKKKIVADFAFPPEKITVIPWGIDVESIAGLRGEARDRKRKELGWDDRFLVIMTRNHEQVYGIDVFLRAMADVVRHHPRVGVVMIGGGSLSPSMKELARSLGLDPFMRWTGKIPRAELLEYLHAADLYVSTSHSDGTSVSLLEAMAAGLSSVLTDVPSNLEWVTTGENGEIVPRGDARAVGEAIGRLIADPARNTAYGRKNLEIVRARGDWKGNFRDMEEIYRMLKGGSHRR